MGQAENVIWRTYVRVLYIVLSSGRRIHRKALKKKLLSIFVRFGKVGTSLSALESG